MKTNNLSKLCFVVILALSVSFFGGNNVVATLDEGPPLTLSCFNDKTGIVTLIAFDFPCENTGTCKGVKATYYEIDDGETQNYTGPFKLPEGTHTIYFWSVDICDNYEDPKMATYTFDSMPPTVEIAEPDGGIYLMGNKVIDYGKSIYFGGDVKIQINADDGPGVGVKCVFFKYSNNDSGADCDGGDGWTDTFRGVHFGELTIIAKAMDKKGLISEPVSKTIIVYSLGFL